MSKLKKLTIKKEVIARINDNQMNQLWGKGNFCDPNTNQYSHALGCTLGGTCCNNTCCGDTCMGTACRSDCCGGVGSWLWSCDNGNCGTSGYMYC